ncbi:MAG: anaerobic ribonucleoside-triphosphate reductase [Victivallaceae bacterium]|nr:anaerobic ribonucleoside-triphosphate reductase [Victivallaceae bacterium]
MAVCGEKTEIYSRVVGYFRPVSNWNRGKQEEFNDRKTYVVGRCACGK